ncbi:MAG: F0F1 ATP synthase subunit epsilon [Chloroflexota bacterium]
MAGKLRLQVVTAERITFDDEVDAVIAPGTVGELGILPMHAPLITTLAVGPLRVRQGNEEILLALTGGYLEVRDDRVIVLAEAAERGDEIDIARAEASRERALQAIKNAKTSAESIQAAHALQRSLIRLRVARPRRRSPGPPGEV